MAWVAVGGGAAIFFPASLTCGNMYFTVGAKNVITEPRDAGMTTE